MKSIYFVMVVLFLHHVLEQIMLKIAIKYEIVKFLYSNTSETLQYIDYTQTPSICSSFQSLYTQQSK